MLILFDYTEVLTLLYILWCACRSRSASSTFFSFRYHNVLTFLLSGDFCLYRLAWILW